MKFPSFTKSCNTPVSETGATVAAPNLSKAFRARLRKHLSFHAEDLPDAIRIPANGTTRPDEVIRLLHDATIDDIAFAIQGTQAESSAVIRRSSALKELYDAARKRGALGTTTVADVFASATDEEVRK